MTTTTLLPTAADCRLRVAGTVVELSGAQARAATMLAAVTRRDGRTQEVLARALGPALEAPDGEMTPAQAARALAGARGPVGDRLPLARALLGHGEDRLACSADPDGVEREEEGPQGLTPRAARARTALEQAFGRSSLGGFAAGGVRAGHIEGSAHYEGRAVDVFFRPVTEANRRRGWTLAQWLVARAEQLELDVVIFDARLWSTSRSDDGWRTYRHPAGPTDNPVLLHLDHVHLDVLRGQA